MVGLFMLLPILSERRIDVGTFGAQLIDALKTNDIDAAKRLVANGDSMEARVLSDALMIFTTVQLSSNKKLRVSWLRKSRNMTDI